MHFDVADAYRPFFIKKSDKKYLKFTSFCSTVMLKYRFVKCPSFKLEFHLQTKLLVSIPVFGFRRACRWPVSMFLYKATLVSLT